MSSLNNAIWTDIQNWLDNQYWLDYPISIPTEGSWKGDPNNKVPNIGNVSSNYSNTVVQESFNLSEKTIEVNRAEEVRRDKDKQKDITIGLIDIDTAIMRQLEKFQLSVQDNGRRVKVPIYYSSPEHWKSIQTDGFMRDYNGKIILPAMVFSRITSEKDRSMMMFNRYLKYTVMKKYSSKNRYTPFNLLVGQNVPINEVYGIVMPDHMIFNYHFIVWAEYQMQINKIVERLNFESEDYWGEKRGYRFRTRLESISHTIQLATGQDRMVKAEFDLIVHGYLLPDIVEIFSGTKNTTQKWFTSKKIIMGEETTMGILPTERSVNAEKWRNQSYPNLPSDEDIPSPPIVAEYSKLPAGHAPLSIWTFPAPNNSSDPGTSGQISYDNEYYYVYTTVWKRAPKLLVNEISTLIGEKKWISFDSDYIYILGDLNRIPMSLFNIF